MEKQRCVVSVGAGKNQVPLIKRLVERGYNVISFDKDINAPGRQLSFIFNNISTWDYESSVQWLDSLGARYKGILCFSCGYALVTQLSLINHYRLRGEIKKDYLKINMNKELLRYYLRKFRFTNLTEFNFQEYSYLHMSKKDSKYVIKRKNGVCSEHIQIIDIKKLHSNMIKTNDTNYIIQEYIDGVEYRVISLIQDKKIKFVSIMGRESLANTFFTGRLNPKGDYNNKIVILVEKVIQKFGIIDSALKIDIIEDKNRIEILEIDFGIGGDYFETVISPKCYNYNYIDNYINLMLGLPVKEKKVPDNELYFDYVYNINKSNNLIIDYNKIFYIADKYFQDYEIVKIKSQNDKVKYPKSNMDTAFGIIHNNKNMTNYDVNILFNKALSNEVL